LYKSIPNAGHSNFLPLSILRRAILLLQRQQCVDVAPHRLFDETHCAMAGTPDKIIFTMSHDSHEIILRATEPDHIARRMVFSLRYEQASLFEYYMKFRFAFPELTNDFLENAHEHQRDQLLQALAGKDAYTVHHPYPVELKKLYDVITPLCAPAAGRFTAPSVKREMAKGKIPEASLKLVSSV
jgi:hypothetical protein